MKPKGNTAKMKDGVIIINSRTFLNGRPENEGNTHA